MAGVSAGTVDRVLHNRGDVSAASREKVQKVLDEIDYHPNMFAIGWQPRSATVFCVLYLIMWNMTIGIPLQKASTVPHKSCALLM